MDLLKFFKGNKFGTYPIALLIFLNKKNLCLLDIKISSNYNDPILDNIHLLNKEKFQNYLQIQSNVIKYPNAFANNP